MKVLYEHTSDHVRRDCRTWPQAEQREWLRLFDPATPGRQANWARRRRAPWSRPRQYNVANAYTRYLAVVRDAGLPAAITPAGVRAFVGAQQARCGARTIHGQVAMLKAIGGLLHPDVDWTWLDTSCRNLFAAARRTSKRKTASKHLYSARDLYRLGIELIADGVDAGGTNWRATQQVRDGLFLVLGVMCPERRRALEALRLDEVDPDARSIVIPAERMKTGIAAQRTFPAVVAEAIRLWRDQYRAAHVDPAADHGVFWIAKGGGAVRPMTMATAMRTATKARLGVAVSPHRLRDASATFVLEDMPEHAPLAARVLGHSSQRMTDEYTETADQIAASRQLTAHLDAARRELARGTQDRGATRRRRTSRTPTGSRGTAPQR
jgi:integrase